MSKEPLVDIVVITHDQAGWLDVCVRSVEHFTKTPYRLIVVDSGSKEPKTHQLLSELENRGHTIVRLAENRSFSNAVNAGVAVGSAKFIILLNNDCCVTEGWSEALIQDASDKHTGLVGARSNYAAGFQGNPALVGEPPFLVAVCVCMRREIWKIAGPYDSQVFTGWSGEDLDHAWRVKKAGYELKVSNAFVLHAGSRTLAKTTGDANARALNDAKYNTRLIEKWGKDWVKENTQLQGRGLVATYHAEEWTRVHFMRNLMGLRRSDGVGFEYLHVERLPIHQARKAACDFAVDNGFDWLVQLDDDATFPSDVLRRLLSHNKDVVCALAYQRKPPHLTCAFEAGEDGMLGRPMEGIEHTGLRKVDISGFHCSIMRTSVIKKMREGLKDKDGKVTVPGTRNYFGGFDNKLGEDFAFSINAKNFGIQIYCDTELISGHIGSAIVVDEAFKKKFGNAGLTT